MLAALNIGASDHDPPVDRLEEAKIYLAQGDDLKARRALRAIPWGEQGLLSPEGCRTLGAIQENLAQAAFERMPTDLPSALKSGDLVVLESAVEAGAGREAELAPEVRVDYERFRHVLKEREKERDKEAKAAKKAAKATATRPTSSWRETYSGTQARCRIWWAASRICSPRAACS